MGEWTKQGQGDSVKPNAAIATTLTHRILSDRPIRSGREHLFIRIAYELELKGRAKLADRVRQVL